MWLCHSAKIGVLFKIFMKEILSCLIIALFVFYPSVSRGEVYLTKKEALKRAFPDADEIKKEQFWLDDAQRKKISKLCNQKIEDKRLVFYAGKKSGKVIGYMTIDHYIGKTLPITFMVVLNTDGTVRDAAIMVYREPQGMEVRYKFFLKQFFGKGASSTFRDINAITGATISVRSMIKGVQKAVSAFQVLILNKT